jgi:hypothetical protein
MNKPLSTYDPDVLRQRLVDLGEAYADADAAANLLEETRKTLLAAITCRYKSGQTSHAAAETLAMSDAEYGDHIAKMVEARRVATRARVQYDSARVWVDLVRTMESSRRAEMGMR